MLMLAGIAGLVAIGLALDLSDSGDHEDASADTLPELDGHDETPPLPPVMPGPGPGPEGWGDHSGSDDNGAALRGSDHGDVMEGSRFADELRGGGDDSIHGHEGDDWIQGDAEDGPQGDDLIHGGDGDDWLSGQDGDDTIFGEDGDDTIFAGAGDDSLSGGRGDDLLHAGPGADTLDGDQGDDTLVGHDGPDGALLRGGDGDDTLMPAGNDIATGGAGRDSFILPPGENGIPQISDFDPAEDRLLIHIAGNPGDPANLSLQPDQRAGQILSLNGSPIAKLPAQAVLDLSEIGIVWVR